MTIDSMAELQELVRSGFSDWKSLGDVATNQMDNLILFNYTSAAQYNGRWNWFERVSRGLILDRETGEVVARPFDKFFNWGEGGRYSKGRIVEVAEKLDGSLGILYRHEGKFRIATRGSFDGEQALRATEMLKRYDLSHVPEDVTLLFEIIYPENRVVVDYGDREELVLIGVRNRFNGYEHKIDFVRRAAEACGFSVPKAYPVRSVNELLEIAERLDHNDEGFVVRFDDEQRFKFKSRQYVELHRIVFDLSFKRVLEAKQQGLLDELLRILPNEFHAEVKRWNAVIEGIVYQTTMRVVHNYTRAPKGSRKEFALWVQEHCPQDAAYMFAALDGRDIRPLIYRRAFEGRESA